MKATLEFNLPEEREEFDTCNMASSMHCALHELREYLHRKYKHQEPENESRRAEHDEIVKEFWDILDSNGIDL